MTPFSASASLRVTKIDRDPRRQDWRQLQGLFMLKKSGYSSGYLFRADLVQDSVTGIWETGLIQLKVDSTWSPTMAFEKHLVQWLIQQDIEEYANGTKKND